MIQTGDAPELELNIGGTFNPVLTWYTDYDDGTPVDLTGCDVEMMMRLSFTSPEIIATLSTDDNSITIPDPTSGQMFLLLTATQTASFKPRSCVYDVRITFPGGEVDFLIQGRIKLIARATHDD